MSSDGLAPWDAESVAAGTAGTRFAGRIQHLRTVSSTNTLGLEAAQAGALEGHVWVADEQTAGRGRGGHTWHSESGAGLYLSVLLRPALAPARALHLSLATGLAAQAAVEQVTGCRPDLRWPNDLLFGERKFGGILVETAAAGETLRHAVIGIGLNVAHRSFPDPLSAFATSLLLATHVTVPRERILVVLLQHLDRELTSLQSGAPGLLNRFAAASTWVHGKRVRVGEDPGPLGTTVGLDPRGFLLVQDEGGTVHTILSGGVRPATNA